ncbi:MAG: hypothetical protein ACAH95_05260 [Fimbriimonas sp.]
MPAAQTDAASGRWLVKSVQYKFTTAAAAARSDNVKIETNGRNLTFPGYRSAACNEPST